MLAKLIPNKYLQYAHAVYGIAVVILGALTTAHVATGSAADVLVYIGGALGIGTAASISTNDTTTTRPKNEGGWADPGSLALGVVIGVALFWLVTHR
jgi:hypothetical protein